MNNRASPWELGEGTANSASDGENAVLGKKLEAGGEVHVFTPEIRISISRSYSMGFERSTKLSRILNSIKVETHKHICECCSPGDLIT